MERNDIFKENKKSYVEGCIDLETVMWRMN